MTDADVLRRIAGVDAYLVDQAQKGRFDRPLRVVDLGAGGGRNLTWFLTSDHAHEVHAVEPDAEHRAAMGERLAALGTALAPERVHATTIEDCALPERSFDLVICNAVLHFARDEEHFRDLFARGAALVAPGGMWFARLATSIGMEGRTLPLGRGWHALPDGSERYLADEALLRRVAAEADLSWLEPLKTTLVERARAMSTWVLTRD